MKAGTKPSRIIWRRVKQGFLGELTSAISVEDVSGAGVLGPAVAAGANLAGDDGKWN